jgi:hypothetical protein
MDDAVATGKEPPVPSPPFSRETTIAAGAILEKAVEEAAAQYGLPHTMLAFSVVAVHTAMKMANPCAALELVRLQMDLIMAGLESEARPHSNEAGADGAINT